MTPRLLIPSVAEGDVAASALRTFGALGTAGREIVEAATGEVVRLVGVNWHGAEGPDAVPGGLWARGYRAMMDQMAEAGFNVIRLPVSPAVLSAEAGDAIDHALNPDLRGLSAIEVLDAVVAYAGEIGLRVILDMHRRTPGVGKQEDGLWVSDDYPEARLIADWQALAGRYRGDPTVIGADLFNEPSGRARWSTLDPRTPPVDPALAWSDAAGRIGDAVLEANSDLLILVEGVHITQGKFHWVGGNLRGVRFDPVELSDPTKLVYSPHDYPWGVRWVPWLDGASAADMVAGWRANWSWLYEEGVAPVLIGETGSRLRIPEDALYMDHAVGLPGGAGRRRARRRGPPVVELGPQLPRHGRDPRARLADARGGQARGARRPARAPASRDGARRARGGRRPRRRDARGGEAVPWDRAWRYQTLDLTARAGEDYLAEAGVLHLPRGETAAATTLRLVSDDVTEGPEDFLVRLLTLDGAPLALERATIRDDDGPPAPEGAALSLDAVARSPGTWDLLLRAHGAPPGAEGWRATLHSDLFALSAPVKGALRADGDLYALETAAAGAWTDRLTAELKVPLEAMIGLEEALLFARPPEPIDPRSPPGLIGEGGRLLADHPRLDVEMVVARTYGTAFFARVTVANRSDTTLEDWALRLGGPFDVTGAAKVAIVAQDEEWTTLRAPGWRPDLAPGERFTFGLDAEADLDPAAHIAVLDPEFL